MTPGDQNRQKRDTEGVEAMQGAKTLLQKGKTPLIFLDMWEDKSYWIKTGIPHTKELRK